ncbi:MAG TPA: HAD-IIIA family hydrolase, partial [Bacteroidia bacterium]|nr:HAD-IIIA family hydrolase [Bacteroidia bacterium]
MKAVFFDRDGVLNKELGKYVTHADELEVNNWVVPFMRTLKEAGYSFFIITNQGGIARQLYTENDLFGIHTKLLSTLAGHGLTFTEVFYCPHHPVTSHCLCRKPDNLMLEKAIAKYGVNTSQSF